MTISVLGEAIIDFMPQPDGSYVPRLGGSMFNVAVGLGRLGTKVQYVSPLSTDAMGRKLRRALLAAKVELPQAAVSELPTSLSLVSLDASGAASYVLYRESVADRALDLEEVKQHIPDDCQVFHSGSLAITPADVPLMRQLFQHARRRGILVSMDINVRINVVSDRDAYLKGITSLLPFCDLVKASDEDLSWLGFDPDPVEAAKVMQRHMAGDFVALTLGAAGAWLLTADYAIFQPSVTTGPLIDTLGAGDTFYAGLLSALERKNLLTSDLLQSGEKDAYSECLRYACCVAGINVTREACQPPSFEEVETAFSAQGVGGH